MINTEDIYKKQLDTLRDIFKDSTEAKKYEILNQSKSLYEKFQNYIMGEIEFPEYFSFEIEKDNVTLTLDMDFLFDRIPFKLMSEEKFEEFENHYKEVMGDFTEFLKANSVLDKINRAINQEINYALRLANLVICETDIEYRSKYVNSFCDVFKSMLGFPSIYPRLYLKSELDHFKQLVNSEKERNQNDQ